VLDTIELRCTLCMAVLSRYLNIARNTFAGPKIGKFYAFSRNKNILWFDVPMENSFAVYVLD